MHRFFIPNEWICRNSVIFRGQQVHQIRDVIRLQAGDRITVLDNSGCEYEVELKRITKELVEGTICGEVAAAEPSAEITLYQALLKGSGFELVLQKCTEIGVSRFVPVSCERCVARNPSSEKVERWRKIVLEASEQSGRGKLPDIGPVMPFQQACQSVGKPSFIADAGKSTSGLHSVLRNELANMKREPSPKVCLFIGPEGGFSPAEVDLAIQCGIQPITLGDRVLRAETAGLVTATAILYECGDLDPTRP